MSYAKRNYPVATSEQGWRIFHGKPVFSSLCSSNLAVRARWGNPALIHARSVGEHHFPQGTEAVQYGHLDHQEHPYHRASENEHLRRDVKCVESSELQL